jgi:hypothetical protein
LKPVEHKAGTLQARSRAPALPSSVDTVSN